MKQIASCPVHIQLCQGRVEFPLVSLCLGSARPRHKLAQIKELFAKSIWFVFDDVIEGTHEYKNSN